MWGPEGTNVYSLDPFFVVEHITDFYYSDNNEKFKQPFNSGEYNMVR